jgi:hypothetical protein
MMMVPVHDIDDLLSPVAFCHQMKYKTMHDIFKECPEQHPSKENDEYPCCAELKDRISVKNEINNNGKINTPNDQGMRFGKHFQVTVPEQLGLSLIVNLFKSHEPLIGCQKYKLPAIFLVPQWDLIQNYMKISYI